MEKYTFWEAQAIVEGSERRIRYGGGCWNRINQTSGDTLIVGCQLSNLDGEPWWPTYRERNQKVWQVEPEKPKDIFVWCVCHKNGSSYISTEILSPSVDEYEWWAPNYGYGIRLDCNDLFPKDKPQKFKLVPVDD